MKVRVVCLTTLTISFLSFIYTLINLENIRKEGAWLGESDGDTWQYGKVQSIYRISVKSWESKKKIETFVKSDVAYLHKTRENQKSVRRGAGRGLWLQKLRIKNVMVVS
jgi:hypothetical protein